MTPTRTILPADCREMVLPADLRGTGLSTGAGGIVDLLVPADFSDTLRAECGGARGEKERSELRELELGRDDGGFSRRACPARFSFCGVVRTARTTLTGSLGGNGLPKLAIPIPSWIVPGLLARIPGTYREPRPASSAPFT
jgi:hypothetical protein